MHVFHSYNVQTVYIHEYTGICMYVRVHTCLDHVYTMYIQARVHDTARDPPNPNTTGRSGGPGGPPKVQPAHQTVWKVSRHGLGAVGPLL